MFLFLLKLNRSHFVLSNRLGRVYMAFFWIFFIVLSFNVSGTAVPYKMDMEKEQLKVCHVIQIHN